MPLGFGKSCTLNCKTVRKPTSTNSITKYPSSGTTHSPVPGLTVLQNRLWGKEWCSQEEFWVSQINSRRSCRIHIDLLVSSSWQFEYHKEITFLRIYYWSILKWYTAVFLSSLQFLLGCLAWSEKPEQYMSCGASYSDVSLAQWMACMCHTQKARHINALMVNNFEKIASSNYRANMSKRLLQYS